MKGAKPNFSGYGEGWFVPITAATSWSGTPVAGRAMVSRVTLVPDLKLGIVVLTNQESGAAFQAVTMRALDAYMEAPKTDWIAAYAAGVRKSEGNADDSMKKHEAARAKGSKPSLPLDGYVGTYRDPWYGDVKVSKQGGKLVMSFSKTAQLTGTLDPWQHDTFIAHWSDRSLNGDAFVNFNLDADGKVREVRMSRCLR